MDKEFREFVRLVEMMRGKQREYFRLKDYEALRQSKALERKVDAEVDRLLNCGYEKVGLFE